MRYLAKIIFDASDTRLGKGRQVTTWTKSSVISAAMTETHPAAARSVLQLGTLLVQTAAGKLQDGMSTVWVQVSHPYPAPPMKIAGIGNDNMG